MFTFGINDWWDVSLATTFIKRCMDWSVDEESVHHRTECSNSNFYDSSGMLQAKGGYLGDFKIKARYLLKNTGRGLGARVFFESGIIIPSNNTLRSTPFVMGGEQHRHFSLSDGSYKLIGGFEYSMKRDSYPVFWNLSGNIVTPLNESEHGFFPSNSYNLSFIALSGPPNRTETKFKLTSIGLGVSIAHTDHAQWYGQDSPNSTSTAISPSISFVVSSLDYGTLGISINRAYINAFNAGDGTLDQEASVWGFSLSYRKALDAVIDKLYW